MKSMFSLSAAIFVLLGGTASADPVFNRIASFPVNTNLPADMDQKTETSAEIISATSDGMTLVYSDSPASMIGFIDIADPAAPKPAGVIKLEGEPTSVAVAGQMILAGVNTSENYTDPSGFLATIDAGSKQVVKKCDLAGQPDSIAVSNDGSLVAVAIENERDEDLNDGEIPQMPAGNVKIFKIVDNMPDCDGVITANVSGLAEVAGDDPEPEFVDFNDKNELVVTMQENNHIVVLNGTDGSVVSHFSAGVTDLEGIDTRRDGQLSFTDSLKNVAREPDAVQWIDNDRLVTANEGDYKGGSRGFTIFSKTGDVLYESGADLEHRIAMAGHYPEKRSGKKGAEPEGLEVLTIDGKTYIVVLSERGSIAGVYLDTGAAPEFLQLIPTGLGPEGAIGILDRKLLAISAEVDLIEDGGVRSHVTIYKLEDGEPAYPMIVSGKDDQGNPIGWGALSGLVADPKKAGIFYAVNDSFYGGQPTIFTIDANQKPAKITKALRVTRGGHPAQLVDMEGVATDGKGGFWIASEGRSDRAIAHAIYHVDVDGEITKTIGLPEELSWVEKRFGFEGITVLGEGDDETLWMAVQREWGDDEKGLVKLVSYNLKD